MAQAARKRRSITVAAAGQPWPKQLFTQSTRPGTARSGPRGIMADVDGAVIRASGKLP
jgi:hypothetical protein